MWVLKVMRSTIAATRRGSGKTVPHSLKGRLVAIAMEALFAVGHDLEEELGAAGVGVDVAELVEAEQVEAGCSGPRCAGGRGRRRLRRAR
jgi:hypothetical protein